MLKDFRLLCQIQKHLNLQICFGEMGVILKTSELTIKEIQFEEIYPEYSWHIIYPMLGL